MADETYYSILEVAETASAAEIKAAYRRLIREVHPDRMANAPAYWQRKAEEKAKDINEAYAVLSDPAQRRSYDAQLAAYRGSQPSASTYTQPSAPPPPGPSPQPAQHASANTSQGAPSQYSLKKADRFLLALIGCVFAFPTAVAFWVSSSIWAYVFLFFAATALFFGVAYLYRRKIGRIFLPLGIRQADQQLGVTVAIFMVVLGIGKVASASRDTHFRGSGDHPATSSQISQVKVIDGSLSATTVSGMSNERYSAAYQFTAHIRNDSPVSVYSTRIKIRIFDCPETWASPSHIWNGITYQSGVFDPSPPSSCKPIGMEEEDDFPRAEPGETAGFANFYFPTRPEGSLRWNYEITAMDTREPDRSVQTPPKVEDVYYRVQPWPGGSRDYIFPDGSIISTPEGYALINNDDGSPAQFGKEGFLYVRQFKTLVSVREHVGAKVTSLGGCGTWGNGERSGVCGIVQPIKASLTTTVPPRPALEATNTASDKDIVLPKGFTLVPKECNSIGGNPHASNKELDDCMRRVEMRNAKLATDQQKSNLGADVNRSSAPTPKVEPAANSGGNFANSSAPTSTPAPMPTTVPLPAPEREPKREPKPEPAPVVNASQITLTDLDMESDDKKEWSTPRVSGRIKNSSPYTVDRVIVSIWAKDCDSYKKNANCDILGDVAVDICHSPIPPGQSRDFYHPIRFDARVQIRKKFQWDYEIQEIQAH